MSDLYRDSRSFRTGQANGNGQAMQGPYPFVGGPGNPAACAAPANCGTDMGDCAPWSCRVKIFAGFFPLVPALGPALLSITPLTSVRVHRIMVPSDLASFFVINSIKIGTNDMIISGGTHGSGIAATTLSEVSVDAWVSLDCMNTAQQVQIGVTNIDPLVAHDFRITFIGITPNSTGYTE